MSAESVGSKSFLTYQTPTRDESKALHTLIQISSYTIHITSSTNGIQPSNIKKYHDYILHSQNHLPKHLYTVLFISNLAYFLVNTIINILLV